MSSERMRLVPFLVCIVLLVACPSEESPEDPSEPDAGQLLSDAGEGPLDEPGDEPGPTKPAEPAKPTEPSLPGAGGDNPGKDTPAEPTTPSQPSMNPENDGQDPAKPGSVNMPPSAGTVPQRFFLPTPEPRNTQSPRIEIDAQGGLHAAYPAYAGNGAFYAYCPNHCVDPRAMQVIELPTDGIPSSALLALTPDGRPRVLLSTYLRVYYAECDRECTGAANWTTSVIVDHQSQQDVTGDALAVDSQGRPRFIMHTYVAYLGVGQKEPHTYYAQCDAGCSDRANWRFDSIQDQIWQYSTLRFDAADRAHLSTVVIDPSSSVKQVAYVRCDASCEASTSWSGIQLAPAFENAVAELRPSASLALTSTGGARVVALIMPEPGARALAYFECDQGCDEGNWEYVVISDAYELGSGVDIAVDAKDRPRFVFTLNSNIGLYHCSDVRCSAETATWDLTKVEFASDLTPDTIILWPNCVAGAWFLHDPTLALMADGSARVGYTATDISGGYNPMPDPTMTPCLVGKDMTLGRMALLPSF